MENKKTETPHSDIYQIKPDLNYLDYSCAIEKRLAQAEAIAFMGSAIGLEKEQYVLQAGTGTQSFHLLHDLIQEIRCFHEKMLGNFLEQLKLENK